MERLFRLRRESRRALGGNEDGQAMVEFVLVLPLFLALIFIAIGYGITLNDYQRVNDIARTAARAASIGRFNPQFSGQADPACAAAIDAATQAANGLKLQTQPTCAYPNGEKPNEPVTITVTVEPSNAISSIPFLSDALPSTLTSHATALLQ